MTQRPRAHQLETESRRAFCSSLSTKWIFRDLTPDYGLDGIVEVFDDRGQATGHLFFVQLKATDEKTIAAALRVRVSQRTLQYYRTLALPVLLVVFHAPTSGLYARWVLDRFLELPHRKSKTLTVRLSTENRWTADRVLLVINDLESAREAKRLGDREFRIRRDYEHRRSVNPSDKRTGSAHPVKRFHPGDRVFHQVFGFGFVDQESAYYLFVRFDEDDADRKFLPGDTWEFTRLDGATLRITT